MRIWDIRSKKEVLTCVGHTAAVTSLAWSSDGKWLASGSADKTTIIWNSSTGEKLRALQQKGAEVTSVAWNPKQNVIATAGGSSNPTILLWSTETWDIISVCSGHAGEITDLDWTPAGDRLFSTSVDKMLKIWSPTTGRSFLTLDCDAEVLSVAVHPSGSFVAAGTANAVRVWAADVLPPE